MAKINLGGVEIEVGGRDDGKPDASTQAGNAPVTGTAPNPFQSSPQSGGQPSQAPKQQPQASKSDNGPAEVKPKQGTTLHQVGSKVLQSATLGGGADALHAMKLINDDTYKTIKAESSQFDHDSPWAAAGIDLAVAAITMAIPGVDAVTGGKAIASVGKLGARLAAENIPGAARLGGAIADTAVGRTVAGGANLAGKALDSTAGKGARYGGIQGAVSGAADAGEGNRMQGAVQGALPGAAQGALIGGAAGVVANRLGGRTIAGKLAPEGVSGTEIARALAKDGVTQAQVDNFLKLNPGARMVDFPSRSLQGLVAKAAGTSEGAAERAGAHLDADAANRQGRLVRNTGDVMADQAPGTVGLGMKPGNLDRARKEALDNVKDLTDKKNDLYSQSRQEIIPVSPELKKLLDHPEIKTVYRDSMDNYHTLRKSDPSSDVAKAPKFKVGSEVPAAVLDDTIKGVGKALKQEGTGTLRYGALQSLQNNLKAEVSGTLGAARAMNARLGSETNNTGIHGAQSLGWGWAKGWKGIDVQKMMANYTDEQRKYVAVGAINSMDEYLTHAAQLGPTRMKEIAANLKSAESEAILGPKVAGEAYRVFAKEASRMRTNSKVASGGKGLDDEKVGDVLSHVAVHGIAHATGLGFAGRMALNALKGQGMTEGVAKRLIDRAMAPGGMKSIRSEGWPRKVVEALYRAQGDATGTAAVTRAASNNLKASSTLPPNYRDRNDERG
ncbi:hypothetical protein [Caballeronia sp. LZ035]|uniref:hypothetical protein n=1 Tax=Caballeronia sp. LZ035 TaxID=3038568 RepID=UPI002857268A|nr:hypothetical protein [Caballeronia sp. LZ035]MDR5758197.1 hypothetical protein [Caballeronia sp. LZ035]